MKRIRIVGLAFASVFALCAITASSALAIKEGPNWHIHLDRCVSAATNAEYQTETECALKEHAGSY